MPNVPPRLIETIKPSIPRLAALIVALFLQPATRLSADDVALIRIELQGVGEVVDHAHHRLKNTAGAETQHPRSPFASLRDR